MGYTDVELSILIVDDEEMARINHEYRNIDAPTDVLSFPLWEGEYGEVYREMLGDIVISAPTAHVMSQERGLPLEAVEDLLLVHGVLHLVGFDHVDSREEALEMEEKTLELLASLGHSRDDFTWYMEGAKEDPCRD